MTLRLTVVAALVLFAVAVVALRQTVGGLVNQASVRGTESALLDVRFRLTDLDDKPQPNASVRLVLGNEPWRQPRSAGQTFVTDEHGEHRVTMTVPIDKVQKKMPTNFLDSLFSRPKLTDHLAVAAELDYMTFRWLYVADLYRFVEGGDVLSDGLRVYTRDEQGSYSRKAEYDGKSWQMADLGDMRLTTPGYDLRDFAFDRKNGTRDQWTLSLAFKRFPDPVVR
jgi:hypothetical protein